MSTKEELEPKQIYLTTRSADNSPFYQMYKEYMDYLAYQHSCKPSTYYLKVSEDYANYLASIYKDEIFYNKYDVDMSTGVMGYWRGIPMVVDTTLQDTPCEFEFLDDHPFEKIETIVDKLNSIGCTSFLTPEQIAKLRDKEN